MSAQRRTAVKDETKAVAKNEASAAVSAKSSAPKKKGDTEQPKSVISQRGAAARQSLRDTMAEMKKINWPDQETTRNLTVLVIAISVILGLALGGIDFLLVKLLGAF